MPSHKAKSVLALLACSGHCKANGLDVPWTLVAPVTPEDIEEFKVVAPSLYYFVRACPPKPKAGDPDFESKAVFHTDLSAEYINNLLTRLRADFGEDADIIVQPFVASTLSGVVDLDQAALVAGFGYNGITAGTSDIQFAFPNLNLRDEFIYGLRSVLAQLGILNHPEERRPLALEFVIDKNDIAYAVQVRDSEAGFFSSEKLGPGEYWGELFGKDPRTLDWQVLNSPTLDHFYKLADLADGNTGFIFSWSTSTVSHYVAAVSFRRIPWMICTNPNLEKIDDLVQIRPRVVSYRHITACEEYVSPQEELSLTDEELWYMALGAATTIRAFLEIPFGMSLRAPKVFRRKNSDPHLGLSKANYTRFLLALNGLLATWRNVMRDPTNQGYRFAALLAYGALSVAAGFLVLGELRYALEATHFSPTDYEVVEKLREVGPYLDYSKLTTFRLVAEHLLEEDDPIHALIKLLVEAAYIFDAPGWADDDYGGPEWADAARVSIVALSRLRNALLGFDVAVLGLFRALDRVERASHNNGLLLDKAINSEVLKYSTGQGALDLDDALMMLSAIYDVYFAPNSDLGR